MCLKISFLIPLLLAERKIRVAGFSSLIAQLELPVRVFIDGDMKRSTSITLVVALTYLLGSPSAINLNILANQDFVWG